MRENLDRAIGLILGYEQGYTAMDRDPGGPTNLGITQATLAAWRGRPVTAADVRGLLKPEAEAIYHEQYADPIRFDDLPGGLDLCVMDCAVNSGPARAAKLLQGVLGVETDGIIGVHTLKALDGRDPATLLDAYCTARLAFLKALATWDAFGRGWQTRVFRVRADAAALANGADAPLASGSAANGYAVSAVPLPPTGQAKGVGAVKVSRTASGKAAIAAFASVAGTAVVTVGDNAGQASAALQPYAEVRAVHWLLLGLAAASATGTLVVALRRANAGATT